MIRVTVNPSTDMKKNTLQRGRGRPRRQIPLHLIRVRVDAPVWTALVKAARSQGTTPSAVLREYAERYIQRVKKSRRKE